MNIQELIKRNALFVVNHSGGKDSQAMLIKIRELVPAKQLLVVHAELPGVDWDGTEEHARKYASDLNFISIRAKKTFFEMVRHRKAFPSPKYRQCTSDLKRGPIEKAIRHWIKNNDLSGLVVNCMGIRAEESSSRAKQTAFKFNKRNSKAGREWYDWLPIFSMLQTEVFQIIKTANQEPHWAYRKGMSRLSCCFCIMASKQDLKTAAQLNPTLYKEVVELEKEVDHTMSMSQKGLEEITGIKVEK